jgi:hypothetical protein
MIDCDVDEHLVSISQRWTVHLELYTCIGRSVMHINERQDMFCLCKLPWYYKGFVVAYNVFR